MSPDLREPQAEVHTQEAIPADQHPSRLQRARDGAKERLIYEPIARFQSQRQLNRDRRNYRPVNVSDEYLRIHDKRIERRQKIDRVASVAIIGGVALLAFIRAAKGYDLINFHNPPGLDVLPYFDGDVVDTWPGEGTPDLLNLHNPPGLDVLPFTDGPGDWVNDDYITDWRPGGEDLTDKDTLLNERSSNPNAYTDNENLNNLMEYGLDHQGTDTYGAETAGNSVEQPQLTEKEKEIGLIQQDFYVETGKGVTHEIIDQGQALGIDVSSEESYEIYQELEARFGSDMIQGQGTYQYNEEVRISSPGWARWNAEAIELMQRQLEELEEDD